VKVSARTCAGAPLEPNVVALEASKASLREAGCSKPTPSLSTIEEVLRVTV